MKIIALLFLLIACGKQPLFSSSQDSNDTDRTSNIQALTAGQYHLFGKSHYFGIKFDSSPKIGENSSFVLKFWNKDNGHFLGPYTQFQNHLCVFLWMKMPDGSEHGSAPLEMNKIDDYYLLDEVYFIMSGKWAIHIRTVENISHCANDINDPYLEEVILDININ